jgi:single-stranded-DNA-specific exonuclease
MKRWVVTEPAPEEVKARFPGSHPVALTLLWNRGIRTRAEADVFLSPDWSRDTFGPEQFQNMPAAVARMYRALESGERITVHGDYDADGVCGSTILVSTLRDICRKFGFDEKNISAYIPHREKEGYGMSVATMELLASEGTKLVVTVDCGISNKPAIDRGLTLGVDTIVCDHHAMPDVLPQDAILLHPQVPGETYPNKHLCGTGVAFKFASGLIIEARKRGATWPEGQEKWLLDLVAVATVTDVMPLKGENRTLESFGLKVLNKTKRIGLRKLIEVAGGKPGELDTFSIGFQIGPRLNAAGRMDHANAALYLLLEEDEAKATELAMKLNETNVERQKASEAMYQEAKKLVGEPDKKVIIVAKEGWPAGLVGLVAGKLVNDFSRPVYVVGIEGDKYVGSGRTYGGFDVTAALHACEGNLDRFGGHPQACGFSTMGAERFAKVKALLEAHADKVIMPEQLEPVLKVDAAITLEEADWALIEALEKFEPFGEGNLRPVFSAEKLRVAYCDTLSDGKHLRLTVRSPGGRMAKLIGFRMGGHAAICQPGTVIDAAFELGVNEWKGTREIQLKLVDIRV